MLDKLPKDILGKYEELRFILSNKTLNKLSIIKNCLNTRMVVNLNAADEVYADIYKNLNDEIDEQWNDLTSLKTIYVPEPAGYYEARISTDENDSTVKHINGISLCEAELSQILLFDIEINTKADILREDYTIPTTFYNEEHPEASLLNRLLEKAPHYNIGYVTLSLRTVQKTYTFDSISLYDALIEISDEMKCLFQFDSITRTINVYDLQYYCNHCGHREDNMSACPNCGSHEIIKPYGKETSIYLSKENVAESLTLEDNSDQMKNCFKLKAGDALMTATIKNLNPNGSDYIYYFSEETKKDMPADLSLKLTEYDDLHSFYMNDYHLQLNEEIIGTYNHLIKKYNDHKYASYKYNNNNEKVLTDNNFIEIDNSISGFNNIIQLFYSNIDFKYYLESSLLPTILKEEQTAQIELEKVLTKGISPIGLSKVTSSTSQQTAESAIRNYINFILDKGYIADIQSESFDFLGENASEIDECRWRGKLHIYKNSNKEDTILSSTLTIIINNDYETYLKQKIEKELSDNEEYGSIYDIINISYSETDTEFKNALIYYSKNRLQAFFDAYEAALNILADLGQGQYGASFYESFYLPYFNRKNSIQYELELRTSELETIDILSTDIEEIKSTISGNLNLKNYLGEELWKVFNAYRREDTYENTHYISTNLDNAKLIKLANEFIDIAKKELIKSATRQVTLSGTFQNFLGIEAFKNAVDHLEMGCWLRIGIDDKVYKVRLISFEVSLDEQDSLSLTFSNVIHIHNILSDIQSILNSAKSMSTNYSYVTHQATQGADGNAVVQDWLKDGLDLTKLKIFNDKKRKVTTDKNGLTLRAYDDITNAYEPEQMKLTETSILLTDDDWKTVKTAIGKYWYIDPITNERKSTYGINAETLIGRLIIGESVKLSNKNGTMIFDENGLTLNSLNKNGKYRKVFTIQKDGVDKLYIDDNGNIVVNNAKVSGEISALSGLVGGWKIQNNKLSASKTYTKDGINNVDSAEITSDNGGMLVFDKTATSSSSNLSNKSIYHCTLGGGALEINYKYSETIGSTIHTYETGTNFTGGGVYLLTNGQVIGSLSYNPATGQSVMQADKIIGSISQGSLESLKDNIEIFGNATDILKKSSIYKYKLKTNKSRGLLKENYGFVIGKKYNTPEEVLAETKDSIELYSMAAINWQATKELIDIIDKMNERINYLEKEIKQINEKGV